MDRIARAASHIAQARRSAARLGILPAELRPADPDEAYLVQDALHELLAPAAGFGKIVGYKIGCTTPVMQRYLGIATPCAGGVFAATVHRSGVRLVHGGFHRVGVECEIAVRLGRDLLPAQAPFDRAMVARAVECYMSSVELVDDRYADWRSTDAATLIADDFFGAGCVLGEPVAPDSVPDLAAARGRTLINGAEVGTGSGADVMGHPLAALTWLANTFAARGRALRAGEMVTTGSLVQTLWLAPGDAVRIEVEGLGAVELTVAAG